MLVAGVFQIVTKALNLFCSTLFLNSFWVMPAFLLKKMIMNNFTTEEVDVDIADSIDFMVERVSEMALFNKLCRTLGNISLSDTSYKSSVYLSTCIAGLCCMKINFFPWHSIVNNKYIVSG